MKKSLVAGASVAAFGLAALPVLGAFAATSTITDTIKVTIASACAITSSNTSGGVGDGTHTDNTYNVTMQNGQLKSDIGGSAGASSGSVITVACNDSSASTNWTLTAVGGDGTTASTVLKAAAGGTDIATNTNTSGAASGWAMKVTGASGVTMASGFNTDAFVVVPGSATTVATGSGAVANAFTMTYQVYIGSNQTPDTYTGKVTYTLTAPGA